MKKMCQMSCGYLLYSVQKAGVVFQAIRNKKIESVHVSLDKDVITRVTLDK